MVNQLFKIPKYCDECKEKVKDGTNIWGWFLGIAILLISGFAGYLSYTGTSMVREMRSELIQYNDKQDKEIKCQAEINQKQDIEIYDIYNKYNLLKEKQDIVIKTLKPKMGD